MPIRPENRGRYPADWREISARIRARAGNQCEWCGVGNHELGGRTAGGTWLPALPLGENGSRLQWPQPGEWAWCGSGGRSEKLRIVRIVLTVAHLDQQPENCTDENLKALCQRCHNRYDAPTRRAGIVARARAACAVADLFEESDHA